MRLRPKAGKRRGASLEEAVILIMVFLTIILGMIDLGMGVFRSNLVSQLARQGARMAIVHGSKAPSGWQGGPWGPSAYGPVSLNDSGAASVAGNRAYRIGFPQPSERATENPRRDCMSTPSVRASTFAGKEPETARLSQARVRRNSNRLRVTRSRASGVASTGSNPVPAGRTPSQRTTSIVSRTPWSAA